MLKIISITAFVNLFFPIGVKLKSINKYENFSKFKNQVEESIFSYYYHSKKTCIYSKFIGKNYYGVILCHFRCIKYLLINSDSFIKVWDFELDQYTASTIGKNSNDWLSLYYMV